MIDEERFQEAKYQASKFLRSHPTMALASVSSDLEPQISTVYFVSDEDFNIFFLNRKKSKKSDNLRSNGKVAFMVGQGPEVITVQGGGQATELNTSEAEKFYELIKKTALEYSHQWPILHLAKHGYDGFKITPSWMTYLNMEKGKYPNIASEKFYQII